MSIKINKVFQIGFNKCGTISIHNLFVKYSNPVLSSIHWNYGYLAKTIHENISSGNFLPLFGYGSFDVFTDMECFIEDNSKIQHISIAEKYFDLLDINYPDSVFILNTRNIDSWIQSRLNHLCFFGPIKKHFCYRLEQPILYIDLFKTVYNTNSTKDITDIWVQNWKEHHENVSEYFSKRPRRLLVYDIDNDDFSKIKNFFKFYNIDFTTNQLPHDNRRHNNII
jgi:hypothetical protein